MDATALHRAQFAFTITYHYLFPQLTMGLALALVILRYRAVFRGDIVAGDCARFLGKIFGLNFVMGVVTGIPMEFQFGAGFARFSRASGNIIGQTLAMEGIFAFFLESAFLYFVLFGEKKLKPKVHFACTGAVLVGSWLSAYFIIVTNAWMQRPVGYEVAHDGTFQLTSIGAFLTNRWALVAFAHSIVGSCVTAFIVISAIGAFYALTRRSMDHAKKLLTIGVIGGAISCVAIAMPTGDLQAREVVAHQPISFAAMEGHFHTEDGAGLVLIGQPNMEKMTLDNPIVIPRALSFMTYQRFDARIEGLSTFERSEWPDNVPLLYYSYHVMVGLGTILLALMALAALLLWRKRLPTTRPVLWALMLAFPLPYVANTAGWLTAELGRQPWIIHGLMRTKDGTSDVVSEGNVLFALLGYMGLYAVLSLLFFFLFVRILTAGPSPRPVKTKEASA